MEWLLGLSVVFNIALLVFIIFLFAAKVESDHKVDYYNDECSKWEQRFYETQALVFDKFNCHVSPSGLPSEAAIKERNS